MFGIGGQERPKMVALDIIGTVFPWSRSAPLLSHLACPGGPGGLFAAGCRDAFAMAAAGDFEPFTTVLGASLEDVLAEQGLEVSAHERRAVVRQLEALDARDGARYAFALPVSAGIAGMALLNGTKSSTKTLLERAGSASLWRRS